MYINTPTWYDLTTSNYTILTDGKVAPSSSESYDFKLYTPWKFGLSLGHTIDNYIALGATYEYADYGSMDTRVNDGGYYDYYDSYYETSSSDKDMNSLTEKTLKGVHTFKVGAEVKVTPQLAVRVGYNYLSAMYNKNGSKDGSIASPGTYYESQTSYVNWKDTNRFTCGLGYSINKFNIDLAYQYSAQNGDFYPFMNYYNDKTPTESNVCTATKVDNKHSQLLLTLGYRF
jgi:opacity protein-like surface antigen